MIDFPYKKSELKVLRSLSLSSMDAFTPASHTNTLTLSGSQLVLV